MIVVLIGRQKIDFKRGHMTTRVSNWRLDKLVGILTIMASLKANLLALDEGIYILST
jgi:hypothetical protein